MNLEIIDWAPEKDQLSKKMEFQIHHKLHDQRSREVRSEAEIWGTHRLFRIKALELALKKLGVDIHGSVLEIGAGDGWCSAYIAKQKNITELYSLECNRAAVEKLIPNTFKSVGASLDKVKLVVGSFNNIPMQNHYDYIIAMGALHHSENLYHTLREAYKALKPGGYLIAQEPFMSDTVKNDFFFSRHDKKINFWGVAELLNSERTDLFYRACEYKTAAYHAGFDFEGIPLEQKSKFMRLFSRQDESLPKNMVMMLRKPTTNSERKPPTSWELS